MTPWGAMGGGVIDIERLEAEEDLHEISSQQDRASVTFGVYEIESLVVQIGNPDGLSAWPTSLVLTLEGTLAHEEGEVCEWSAMASPVTYTSFGLKAVVDVRGLGAVRVRVSTVSSGGHGMVGVQASGYTARV